VTDERWPRVKALFQAAIERPAEERDAFLAAATSDDDALRREVESLLASDAGFPDPVPVAVLTAGVRVGAYEIVAPLGAGAMGDVYRASDTKLNREIALKVLPELFALDPDRRARFTREAQLLAALNHPNIAAIYGLEESNGTQALVLELVEGPTLAERIALGPISLEEALAIARQIAEALGAAHEKGIIHRDLKPANIKVAHYGVVKVLDFGLAKVWEGACQSDVAASPRLTATDIGGRAILGTPAYMSPEQALGLAVDKGTDIWAFGCVFYEMLTGRSPFPGDTASDTIAAVLEREPDWAALSADVPESVRTLLRRCLAKDRRQRIADISVVQFILDDRASAPPLTQTMAPRPPLWRRMAIPSSTWLIAVALSGAAIWFLTRPTIPTAVTRFLITPPSATALTVSEFFRDLALTPDGTRLVYVGADGAALFVRPLDQLDATPLTGFAAALGPFVSPDGQWIGVWDGAGAPALKKVAITGGPPVTLGRPDGSTRGASWGADDTIIFATTNVTTGLQRIAAAGGQPTVLTRPNRAGGEADHVWPEILPGGQAVLFTITSATGRLDQAQIAALDLQTGTQTVLIRGGSDARYVPSGHLIYAAAGTFRAIAFDLARLAVAGASVAVLPPVQMTATGAANVAVAADGTLVYIPGGVATWARSSLVWVDRQGAETPVPASPRSYVYPRLSPDGTRLAFFISEQELDVWLWDLARPALTRATFDPGLDTYPVWTPDGRQLLFSSERAGARNLFAQAADGTGALRRLTESPNAQLPTSISPDGTRLVFTEIETAAGDVWQLRLDGRPAVTPLVRTPFNERNGEVSPDGRWLAYEANDSGRFEVYVRPFPDVTRGRWQVSTNGGTRPLWARNSQELFYLAPPDALMRVGVARASTWAATAPTKLFEGDYGAAAFHSGRTYDVSPDGRRFLMIKNGGAGDPNATPASMVVVLNWTEELKQRVPTN
jgi:serine/threonine protein kinase/Tol biopolymer transport system component